MTRKRLLVSAALSALGAVLAFFVTLPQTAAADIAGPSIPLSGGGSWVTWVIVLVCVLAAIAVALGVFFIRRARARRRSL